MHRRHPRHGHRTLSGAAAADLRGKPLPVRLRRGSPATLHVPARPAGGVPRQNLRSRGRPARSAASRVLPSDVEAELRALRKRNQELERANHPRFQDHSLSREARRVPGCPFVTKWSRMYHPMCPFRSRVWTKTACLLGADKTDNPPG